MKIITGKFKGRNFFMPKDIRPTQNMVRKALFDILGDEIMGITFLDMFAGSGAVGFEALSRGARRVILVEKDQKCAETIDENAQILLKGASLEEKGSYGLINNDAFAAIKALALRKNKFDFVFFDPPYGRELAKKALKQISAYDIVQPSCTVIAQHDKREKLPQELGNFIRFRQNKYGSTVLSFYKQAAAMK